PFSEDAILMNSREICVSLQAAPQGLPMLIHPHMPERSGLPLAVRGAGEDRFGLPSEVFGTLGVGYPSHCAGSVATMLSESRIVRVKMAREVLFAISTSYRLTGINFNLRTNPMRVASSVFAAIWMASFVAPQSSGDHATGSQRDSRRRYCRSFPPI